MPDNYDTIIVGAGPGGAAAAYYLAKQGLDVLLLDKFNFPRDKTCGDGLTPRALSVLDDMGLLNDLQRVGYRINKMEIRAPNGYSIIAPVPKIPDTPGYTLIVPRMILDNAICEWALASGATFQQVHVTGVEQAADGVVVKGERQGQTVSFKARMVIIATGANLKLLLRMGLLQQRPPMMLAARAYFEGVTGLSDRTHFHFDGVPLPGYGWVFPVSETSANIGVGFFGQGRARRRMPATPAKAFEAFIKTPPMQKILVDARQVGPVKGYPLRVDFATSPTFAERVMLVGEAAGLVNPLSGEGIDYALESGQIAARHLASMFATGDFSPESLAVYEQLLHQRFQRLFLFCNRTRDLCLNRPCLNWLVKTANRRPGLKMMLLSIVLGNQNVATRISPKTVLKALLVSSATDLL